MENILGYNTIDYKGDNQAIIIPNACAVGYFEPNIKRNKYYSAFQ
jgi:hypothetical protein